MRSGRLSPATSTQYAPVLQWLWRPFLTHGLGPGWVLGGQAICFVAGAFLIARLVLAPVLAALVVAAVSLSP
ncbi:MAG: hypothetical protein ACR2QA_10330 [Solirubrobacteraceae bacterium]